MSRNNRSGLPRINNSGRFREPTNVFAYIEGNGYAPFQLNFYEFELQELAANHPDWIIFVKPKGA